MEKIYGGLLIYGIKLELKHIPILVHHGIIKCADPITWPIYWPEMVERFPTDIIKFVRSSNLWEQLYYIMYGHNCNIPTLLPDVNKLIMDYTVCGKFGEMVLELLSGSCCESWLPISQTGVLMDNWISSNDWDFVIHRMYIDDDDYYELYIGSLEYISFKSHGKKFGHNIDTQSVDEMLRILNEETNAQFIFFNGSFHGDAWQL